MREVWDRKKPLLGWKTGLIWLKSGSASKVYDTPYEIYQKRYGPDVLSDPGVNAEIALRLTSEVGSKTRGRIPGSSTIEVTLSVAVGKSLETRNDSRKAYRTKNKVATFHSRRYLLEDLSNLTGNLIDILDKAAQLPSAPAWLAMVQVTIRVSPEERHLVRKPRYAHYKIVD